MIHALALAVGISDGLAQALVTAFSIMFVALIGLVGIVLKGNHDVRTIRNRVTSNVEDRRHEQNTRRFARIERNQKENNKAIVRIEDKLGIEHTIVPVRNTRKASSK